MHQFIIYTNLTTPVQKIIILTHKKTFFKKFTTNNKLLLFSVLSAIGTVQKNIMF